MNKCPKKLKRVPLKEELVSLTGCFIKALILQQFLYWSERVSDFDDFILEEKERSPELELELRHGWIYKSTEQLHDELMFGDSLSPRTVKRRLDEIVNGGYLVSRNNPNHKWDRCLQYRPDIIKIQINLQEIGYALEGYPLFIPPLAFDTVTNASGTVSNQDDKVTNRTVANVQAIPETTTETTTETLKASSAKADYSRPISLLLEKEVRALKLPLPKWKEYLADEQAERGRTGVLKFIERKLELWELMPHNEDELKLFEILAVEYEADGGKSPPSKFPSLETKRLFNEAAEFHNGTLESVIKKAIHKRGKGIAKIVDYINSPNWKGPTSGQTKRDQSGSKGISSQARNFEPGNGRTPEMQAALERAFAPNPG